MNLDRDLLEAFFSHELQNERVLRRLLWSIPAAEWPRFRAPAWSRLRWEKRRLGIVDTADVGAYGRSVGQRPAETAAWTVLGRKEWQLWREQGRRLDGP